MKSDEYTIQAVQWALSRRPCVISCQTVAGMNLVRADLDARNLSSSYVRVSTPHHKKVEEINAFESGVTEYLIIAAQLLYVDPNFRFRRVDAYIASANALVQSRGVRMAALLGPVDMNRVFFPLFKHGAANE